MADPTQIGPFMFGAPMINPTLPGYDTSSILTRMGLLTPKTDPAKRPVMVPVATKPKDATSGYTPDNVLKSQADTANWYQSRPLAPMAGTSRLGTVSGGVANFGNGFMSTYIPRQAEEKMKENQRLSEQAMQSALNAPDLSTMMKSLAGSGNPKYQDMAAQLMLQRGTAQEDQRQKMDMWNKLLAEDSPIAGAPPASAGGQSAASPPQAGATPISPVVPQQSSSAAPIQPPAEEPPVEFKPPPRQPLGSTERRIIAAQMAGMPKEVAERLDPNRNANEAQDKELGKGYGERFQSIMKARDSAYTRVNDLKLMEQLTLNPDTLMGPASEAIGLRLRKLGAAIGMDTGEMKSLNSTQLYQALMNRMALEARNPAGGAGMPGSMSDSDREFLAKIAGGMPNTREANIALIRINQLKNQRELDMAKNAADYAANNGGRLDVHFDRLQEKWAKQNPMFKPQEFQGLFDSTPPSQTPSAANAQPSAATAAPLAQPWTDAKAAKPGDTRVMPEGSVGPNGEDLSGARMIVGADGKWRKTTFGEDVSGMASRAKGIAGSIGNAISESDSLPAKGLREIYQKMIGERDALRRFQATGRE